MSDLQNSNTGNGGDLVGTADDRGVHQEGNLSRYTTDERARLRALMGADDASDADLDVLAMVSQRSGLDPFLKQIYLVGRRTKTGGYRGEPERWETKWTVQSSIDGLREVLFRTADAKGVDCSIGRPVWFDADGSPHRFWVGDANPTACEVEVTLGGRTGYGVATWDQFCQTTKQGTPNSMWSQMGPHMLAKCAKALAIRDVCSLASGIYIDEEMQQAENRVFAEARRTDTQPKSLSRGSSGLQSAIAAPEQEAAPEWSEVGTIAAGDIERAETRSALVSVLENAKKNVGAAEYKALRTKGTQRWNELPAEDITDAEVEPESNPDA
ncbi:recombinase RecT [Corynebacterium lujinxingii]|uniref:Recombinase RecT n=1 Tax=Corynebacterium lujinxingii TaxID=2763010 RepID=A0A7H0JWP9_9CORY|nr:recombinase RecT [Corynebacterium lujinxingii]MBC3178121.1 recombinase RecT [Corynebacterium lujinxingii]NNO09639.1 hypothetical protein [Corynebacterium lujinxingii]QNP89465.1 recombinase RecT [Corynebacterium lujinxingii]